MYSHVEHGCRKRGGGGGGGRGAQAPPPSPQFFGLGAQEAPRKWYQHLQNINHINHADLRTINLCIESSNAEKMAVACLHPLCPCLHGKRTPPPLIEQHLTAMSIIGSPEKKDEASAHIAETD